MWFEIIPSLGIVGVCLFAIPMSNQAITWLGTKGHTEKRFWYNDNRDFMQYLKDERLTGSVYVQKATGDCYLARSYTCGVVTDSITPFLQSSGARFAKLCKTKIFGLEAIPDPK